MNHFCDIFPILNNFAFCIFYFLEISITWIQLLPKLTLIFECFDDYGNADNSYLRSGLTSHTRLESRMYSCNGNRKTIGRVIHAFQFVRLYLNLSSFINSWYDPNWVVSALSSNDSLLSSFSSSS